MTQTSPKTALSHGDFERYLCFSLGQEEFAIELLSVKEVIAIPEITPVPQTPPHFLGIINLRGQIISVMDLRQKLGIKAAQSEESAVIICDWQTMSLGVIVDSINRVIQCDQESISKPPEGQNLRNTEFITGIYRQEDKLVLLLDIAKTLGFADLKAVQNRTQAS